MKAPRVTSPLLASAIKPAWLPARVGADRYHDAVMATVGSFGVRCDTVVAMSGSLCGDLANTGQETASWPLHTAHGSGCCPLGGRTLSSARPRTCWRPGSPNSSRQRQGHEQAHLFKARALPRLHQDPAFQRLAAEPALQFADAGFHLTSAAIARVRTR